MGFKRLERALTSGFRWYGNFVGKRPLPFFLIPFLITLLLAPGLFFVAYDDDVIMLFTPYDAPSRHEQEMVREFSYVQPLAPVSAARYNDRSWNGNLSAVPTDKNGKPQRFLLQTAKTKPRANPWIFLNVYYANESNILNVETFQYVSRVFSYLYYNFTCRVQAHPNDGSGPQVKILRYIPDYCNPDDPKGYECPKLDKQMAVLAELVNRSTEDNTKVRLTYPVMYLFLRPFNWGQIIYGATTNARTGKLESAKVLALKLDFQYDMTEEDTFMAKQCDRQINDFFLSLTNGLGPESLQDGYHRGVRFTISSQWSLSQEVMVNKDRTSPCISITTILVTLFTTVSLYYARAPVFGAIEALLGVFTIGLSLAATFAFLFLCGLPFNFVTIMTPLLTLCVGIDNDFLLMSAWRRPHLEGMPAKQRLAYAFAEAGPSLTITSINDVLCFAVGCLSESPAISKFCLFTCIALTFRYLYQLTFFSGAMVFITEKAPKIEQLFRKCVTKLPFDTKVSPWKDPTSVEAPKEIGQPEPHGDTAHGVSVDNHVMHRFFRQYYSAFLSRSWVRFTISLIFTAYLVLSFMSISKLVVKIQPTKLFMDDSPLQTHFELGEKYVLRSMIGNVIVKNPPDFRNKSNVKRFLEFVDNLERTPKYAPDPRDTTTLWLRDYLDFSSYVGEPVADFYDYLSMFFDREEYTHYINDMRFNFSKNGRVQVESFTFSTYYRNVSTWDDSAKILLLWRRVCQNYSEYEAIVHDYYFRNSYLDQKLTLPGSTLQTMGIASLSIAFITSLFMPDMTSIFFTCFSSLSVDLGVMGILNAWGSDLDPITMACLLMTIGFSVYYTARICYCYQKVDKNSPIQRKLGQTLGSVGWPILQGGMATLTGIIPLAFIHSYMLRTFFRTIVLVVFVGLLHGLVFMPVLMSLFDRQNHSLKLFAKIRQEGREATRKGKRNWIAYGYSVLHCKKEKA